MDLISRYRQFSDSIDGCQDEQQLKQYQSSSSINTMVREYWKQRQLVTGADTPLERQQALVKLQWLHHFFGCNIAVKRNIKKFTAPNGLFGIFIAPEASVNDNCVIFQQVYIGGDTLADSPSAGFPVVGKNVYIGAGARIVGNVVIGNGCRIDPGCYVNFDVPANSHVTNTGAVTVVADTQCDNRHLSAHQYMTGYFSQPAVDCTDNPSLHTRKALPQDIDDVILLYKDRVNWFKWKKISQWTFYLTHHPREEFVRHIADGNYYVVTDGDNIVAGFVVSDDSENWNCADENAVYLSRAIAKTNYKNTGSYIAAQARDIAAQQDKSFLRLECVYSNSRLNEIWQNNGFDYIGETTGDYHCSLRQMDLRPESERETAPQQTQPVLQESNAVLQETDTVLQETSTPTDDTHQDDALRQQANPAADDTTVTE
ncbi:MAG: hypothetical protein IKV52_02255 [Oscillospiraceae bacterium]|nr:hypothetical protein [Oscillospiraceae bacterium]